MPERCHRGKSPERAIAAGFARFPAQVRAQVRARLRVPVQVVVLALPFLLASFPPLAGAKGGAMQPKPNKDFRELIVKGERPEIVACLVALIDYARRNPAYAALRWDDDASDRANLRESEEQGRLIRRIRLTVQMRSQSAAPFSGTWAPYGASCEQAQDGAVRVSLTPVR
jgi:hypothetical protein